MSRCVWFAYSFMKGGREMSKKILQINLRFSVSATELAKEFMSAATPISSVKGLKWKIFGMDKERGEGAGIYLFEDENALKSYLEGPIIAGMKDKVAFSDINIKSFDIVEEATLVTRGPI
jgi:hypothetical protein